MAPVFFMVVGGLLAGGAWSVLRAPGRSGRRTALGVALVLLAGLCVANALTRL